jgi:F-type H+-transporting ATPase subunit b
MATLLNPDVGLMVWTVVTFVLVALVLGRFAWRPILQSLEEREDRIRAEVKAAEESRRAAESLKAQYDEQLARVEARAQELIQEAQKEAQRLREEMLKTAQDESARLSEKTRQQLAEEQRRLVQELRAEVADISIKAAEKLLQRSVDKKLQDQFVKEAMADFEKAVAEGPGNSR